MGCNLPVLMEGWEASWETIITQEGVDVFVSENVTDYWIFYWIRQTIFFYGFCLQAVFYIKMFVLAPLKSTCANAN